MKVRTKWGWGVIASLASVVSAHAATQQEIDAAWNKGLAWLIANQKPDGSWQHGEGTAFLATASGVEALRRSQVLNFNYAKAIAWLGNTQATSVDSQIRKIVALRPTGVNTQDDLAQLIAWRNRGNSWGAYPGYAISFPDTALALKLAHDAHYNDAAYNWQAREGTLCGILTSQGTTSGVIDGTETQVWWTYSVGGSGVKATSNAGAIIPTVASMHALKAARESEVPLKNSQGCSYNENYIYFSLPTAIDKGLTWLRSRQYANGGFGEYNAPSALETAAALNAFTTFAPGDAAGGNAVGYLVSTQQADGSWGGDPVATATVLSALPLPTLPMADADADGIPNSVEAVLGTNSGVADSRDLETGNGSAEVTAPSFTQSAGINDPFSYAIPIAGGTPPYLVTLTAGSLPSGLSLNVSGVISGTPASLGSSNFMFKVTDTGQSSAYATGQINVLANFHSYQDNDGDGLTNVEEYQFGTNPSLRDTDGDGMDDGYEKKYGLNPTSNDASLDPDGDGLTNLQEYQRQTNPKLADTDGDGYSDSQEITMGRNPLLHEEKVRAALVPIIQYLLSEDQTGLSPAIIQLLLDY